MIAGRESPVRLLSIEKFFAASRFVFLFDNPVYESVITDVRSEFSVVNEGL